MTDEIYDLIYKAETVSDEIQILKDWIESDPKLSAERAEVIWQEFFYREEYSKSGPASVVLSEWLKNYTDTTETSVEISGLILRLFKFFSRTTSRLNTECRFNLESMLYSYMVTGRNNKYAIQHFLESLSLRNELRDYLKGVDSELNYFWSSSDIKA